MPTGSNRDHYMSTVEDWLHNSKAATVSQSPTSDYQFIESVDFEQLKENRKNATTLPTIIFGFWSLILISLIYEPLRTSLYTLGEEIGGVGGVGGLMNLWNPTTRDVNCLHQRANIGDIYCYHEGIIFGLTPFALLVAIVWTLPFALCSVLALPVRKLQSLTSFVLFQLTWFSLTILWFAVPFAYFIAGRFYRTDFWHVLLAVSIASAYVLSWHLSLLTLPLGPFMHQYIGLDYSEVVKIHKWIGMWTLIFAFIHGGGQLVYMLSQSGTSASFTSCFNLFSNGENLLFYFGFGTFILLGLHSVIIYWRYSLARNFRLYHRFIAFIILLTATCHWWPFVIFLIPSSALHATNILYNYLLVVYPQRILGSSILIHLVILGWTWDLRNDFMRSPDAGLYLPFIFPPLSLLLGFFMSLVIGFIQIRYCNSCGGEHIREVKHLNSAIPVRSRYDSYSF